MVVEGSLISSCSLLKRTVHDRLYGWSRASTLFDMRFRTKDRVECVLREADGPSATCGACAHNRHRGSAFSIPTAPAPSPHDRHLFLRMRLTCPLRSRMAACTSSISVV